MGKFLFHAQDGGTEQTLLLGNVFSNGTETLTVCRDEIHQVFAHLYAEVVLDILLVDIQFLAVLHQHRVLVQVVDISGIIATKTLVNGLIE